MPILLDPFRRELSKLGWIEGKNIIIEQRFGELERLPDLAAELVRLKIDLIVVTDTPDALAAKCATSTIPVVMVSVGDPVAAGLVATLGRPGGNVTGFSNLSVELNTKRLEILKDAIPRTGRVGLVSAAGGGLSSDLQPKELGPAAAVEGSRPVNSVEYSKRKSAGGFTEAAIHSLKGKALAKQKFALSFLAAEDATRIESPCLGMIRRRRGRANTQR